MKYLILIGDGMGDYPLAELDGRTPLEAAATPAMDRLCRRGDLFLTATVPSALPPGSDVANLSLMGYDPLRYYTGRAPLEAASMGVRLAADQTAFRCNLVNLDFRADGITKMIDFTAGHISTDEAAELINSLQVRCGGDTPFNFHAGVSYRHLLTVQGDLPPMETVPPHDYIDQDITPFRTTYLQHSRWKTLLLEAEDVLAGHPVNRARKDAGRLPASSIWPWGEGKMPAMPGFNERFGLTGSMISAVDLLKGIGILAGLDSIDVPGATGYLDTNYRGKADAALTALEEQDFVFVHLEAPDESGHQGSISNKITAIEDFDEKIVGYITSHLQDQGLDYRMVVTMDHFTPISLRTHSRDPVPTLLYDSRETSQGSNLPFSEIAAASLEGVELLAHGHHLINRLLQKPCS